MLLWLGPLLHALLIASSAPFLVDAKTSTVWATPHDSYSSSIGVLGCKVDTNRIAYWPEPVDCTNICVELSYGGRSVHLLRVDQSQGAHDVSYDAWNYLYTGKSATKQPTAGGGVAMQAETVDPSKCRSIIHTKGSKLPLSASNSMNFVASCIAQKDSWVGSNYVLYNILDSICTLGYDEECKLDLATSNQPTCSHQLGLQNTLKGETVVNIQYPTGDKVLASNGEAANSSNSAAAPGPTTGDAARALYLELPLLLALVAFVNFWL